MVNKRIIAVAIWFALFARSAFCVEFILKSSTENPLCFYMTDSSDHVSAKTGLTCTVTLSKAGGSFASPSGSVTEIANGWYKVAGNATDTATLGPLLLHATGSGADAADVKYLIINAFDPQIASGTATGLLTNATPVATSPSTGTLGEAILAADMGMIRNNTAQSGTSTTITLDASASATDNAYQDNWIKIVSGTGGGQQPRTIISYVGGTKVATVNRAWTTTPDNTSVFQIEAKNQVDVALVQGTPPDTTTVPEVNLAAAQTNSVTLPALTITGTTTMSDGLAIARSSSNTVGLSIAGNGTGSGMRILSGLGSNANGLEIASGATTGIGLYVLGCGTGNGATFTGGSGATGNGVAMTSASTNGAGLTVTGTGTGNGATLTGGSTSGVGLKAAGGGSGNGATLVSGSGSSGDGLGIASLATNGNAITASANGTGSGAIFTSGGGATGNGISMTAASTNGSGLALTNTGTGVYPTMTLGSTPQGTLTKLEAAFASSGIFSTGALANGPSGSGLDSAATQAACAAAITAATAGAPAPPTNWSAMDIDSDGNVSVTGSSTLVASVDNTEVVPALTYTLGTRADGVTIASPKCILKVGEPGPIWIETSKIAGGRWLSGISNAASSNTGNLTVTSSGVNQTKGVIWLNPIMAGTSTVTADLTVGNRTIKAQLTVVVQ